MRRFEVYAFHDPGGAEAVVVLQGEHYQDLSTVVVVPLFPVEATKPLSVINPILHVAGKDMILKTDILGPLPRQLLTGRIDDLSAEAFAIQNAIDRLFSDY